MCVCIIMVAQCMSLSTIILYIMSSGLYNRQCKFFMHTPKEGRGWVCKETVLLPLSVVICNVSSSLSTPLLTLSTATSLRTELKCLDIVTMIVTFIPRLIDAFVSCNSRTLLNGARLKYFDKRRTFPTQVLRMSYRR